MLTANEFIRKHKMEYTSIDVKNEMDTYIDEMKKGLCGEKSSLLMIPSYITLKSEVKREKPVICHSGQSGSLSSVHKLIPRPCSV